MQAFRPAVHRGRDEIGSPRRGNAHGRRRGDGSGRAAAHALGRSGLQGNYTNKYEANTPLERPAAFAGKSPRDVTAAEMAILREQRQKQFSERPAAVGPMQFRDPLDVTRGSRPWFLIDPPDGRIPPRTDAARRRLDAYNAAYDAAYEATLDTTLGGVFNSRQRVGGSFGEGPFDTIEDFGLWDRCITRGIPGSMLPHILGNSYQFVYSRPASSPSGTNWSTTPA